jgi:hypothetical protein
MIHAGTISTGSGRTDVIPYFNRQVNKFDCSSCFLNNFVSHDSMKLPKPVRRSVIGKSGIDPTRVTHFDPIVGLAYGTRRVAAVADEH